jgi:hypothetical protein
LRGRSAADAICPNATATMPPINARDKRHGMGGTPIWDKNSSDAGGRPLMDGEAQRKSQGCSNQVTVPKVPGWQ